MPTILLTFFTHDYKLLCTLFGSDVVPLLSTLASLARHLTCCDGSIAASLFLTPLGIMDTFLPQPLAPQCTSRYKPSCVCTLPNTHTSGYFSICVSVLLLYRQQNNKRVQTLDSAWRVLTYDSTTIT